MGKLESNKQLKKESLLNTAFELFTSKGLHNTSITDIVEKAGVAKGTFYLYFKDKYDINQKLIAHKTSALFNCAMKNLEEHPEITKLDDVIIFLINDIFDALSANKTLLIFIAKDLGMGFYHSAIRSESFPASPTNEAYATLTEKYGATIHDLDIMLYQIIELAGSCCYTAICYNEPTDIESLKPHLFQTIRNIIHSYTIGGN